MSFREKSAWISAIAILLTYGSFFGAMGLGWLRPGGVQTMTLFVASVIAFIILQIVLHIIAAASAPQEAQIPIDEREKMIALKSGRNAHIVLIALVLCVPFSMHLGAGPVTMAYGLMLALAVSEFIRFLSVIACYHRGY